MSACGAEWLHKERQVLLELISDAGGIRMWHRPHGGGATMRILGTLVPLSQSLSVKPAVCCPCGASPQWVDCIQALASMEQKALGLKGLWMWTSWTTLLRRMEKKPWCMCAQPVMLTALFLPTVCVKTESLYNICNIIDIYRYIISSAAQTSCNYTFHYS